MSCPVGDPDEVVIGPEFVKEHFSSNQTLNSSGINTVNAFATQTFNVFHIFKPTIVDIKVLKL